MMSGVHDNARLIQTFYEAFAARDAAGMRACYTPEATFEDPVFTLQGKAVGAMWHMLCEGGRDLALLYRDIGADAESGRAEWEARYTFGATGRRVHNLISARFRFEGGRIAAHRDRFSFWRWSAMALGPIGLTLGWTPAVRRRVRAAAQARLEKFMAAHPEYQ
jgi:ketosteroid isomerase-like protein